MGEDEVKKLGPLGLRLVDGLRGPALQVARTLPVDELANDKGRSPSTRPWLQAGSSRTIPSWSPTRRNPQQGNVVNRLPAMFYADGHGMA